MRRFARGFLKFVGAEYAVIGAAGLIAVLNHSDDWLILAGLAALFVFVAPLPLLGEYGVTAGCVNEPAIACNASEVVQHARHILTVLCLLSIAGGLLGIWGVSTRNEKAGRVVWFGLTAVSVAVALWNLLGSSEAPAPHNPLAYAATVFWALAYALACTQAFADSTR